MHARTLSLALLLATALTAVAAAPEQRIRVGDQVYVYRGVFGAGIAEYTPPEQTDLDRFSDMLMALPVPADVTAATLPTYAEALTAQYERGGGRVIERGCEPASRERTATCTLYTLYARAAHTEIATTRVFGTSGGIVSLAYAHREYGEDAFERAKAWFGSPAGKSAVTAFLGLASATEAPPQAASITVGGDAWPLRWNNGTQYEYLPPGEAPQDRWSRMITLQHVPGVRDEAGLRVYTGELRKNVEAVGRIMSDDCAPGADGRLECVLVAMISQGDASEWFISRTVLEGVRGVNASIGRRTYGPDAREALVKFATSSTGRAYFMDMMKWPIPAHAVPDAKPR